MAEASMGGLQSWGTLRLTSSLVVAGFKDGVDADSPMLQQWGSAVVLGTHEKSQQLQGHAHETSGEELALCTGADIGKYRAENMAFFESFTSSLQNTGLQEIETSLKNFAASQGNQRLLAEAHKKAKTAFGEAQNLDDKLTAAAIATSSPGDAKTFTVKGTLSNIVRHFRSVWTDPESAATADGKKVLSFLLSVISCVCALPPEDTPVIPTVDGGLLPVLGAFCAAESGLRTMYPVVAGAAALSMAPTKAELPAAAFKRAAKDQSPSAASSQFQVPSTPEQGGPSIGNSGADRDALMALFRSSKGLVKKKLIGSSAPGWTFKAGWGSQRPIGEWLGVSTTGRGRVWKIDLERNGLRGVLPPELGGLAALQTLRLSNNNLSGFIPPAIGDLLLLRHLILNECQLSGGIPSTFGKLRLLKDLDLGGNRLTGPIPPELGKIKTLENLELQGNNLSGTIPDTLCDMKKLNLLNLDDGHFSGPLPEEMGRMPNLQYMSASHTNLSGQITVLGEIKCLMVVHIISASLSGPIPATLGRLTKLSRLDLRGNQLSGEIPAELGQLSVLRYLDLESNQLTGGIPPELGRLRAVEMLDISKNKLTGRIPKELGRLPAMQYLAVHDNRLTGPVPKVRYTVPRKS
eukprot:g10228.t1